MKLLFALAVLALGALPVAAQDMKMAPGESMPSMKTGPAHPAGIPHDAVLFTGCMPAMGYHYVSKKNASRGGPIYGWYDGKPVFTEWMPTKAQLDAGFNVDDIKALPGYKIDHIDIWYEAHGHSGMEMPHYDIHAWYVPHAQHMKFCGNASGKRPAD